MKENMDEFLISEAEKIVNRAKEKNITLRVMGAVAIRIHCPKYSSLHVNLGRRLTDLDFVIHSKQKTIIGDFLSENNYIQKIGLGFGMTTVGAGKRLNFVHKEKNIKLDIFIDEIVACHTVKLKKRLEVDCPTIPLAELLLEKLQIVKCDEKDIKDLIVLLLEHELGDSDNDLINQRHTAKILANDWGFYYTVNLNLQKVQRMLSKYTPPLKKKEVKTVEDKINALKKVIEDEPKSIKWKMRAKVGPKLKWYREVEVGGGVESTDEAPYPIKGK